MKNKYLVFAVLWSIEFIFLIPEASRAQDDFPKIIISNFDSSEQDDFKSIADSMPDILNACLSVYSDQVTVLDRSIWDDSASQVFPKIPPPSLIAATHILRGSIFPSSRGISVNLLIYDAKSTQLIAQSKSEGTRPDFVSVSCKAAENILKIIAHKNKKNENLQPAKNSRDNYPFLKSIGFYYNGAYEEAIAGFLSILNTEEKNADAQYWLIKSYVAAGMNEEASLEFSLFQKKFLHDKRNMPIIEKNKFPNKTQTDQ